MVKRSTSASASTKRKRRGGHKVAYESSWKSIYLYMVIVESDVAVTGLKCQWSTTFPATASVDCLVLGRCFLPWMKLNKEDCIERHKK